MLAIEAAFGYDISEEENCKVLTISDAAKLHVFNDRPAELQDPKMIQVLLCLKELKMLNYIFWIE